MFITRIIIKSENFDTKHFTAIYMELQLQASNKNHNFSLKLMLIRPRMHSELCFFFLQLKSIDLIMKLLQQVIEQISILIIGKITNI